jgi:hypothetical protein
MIADRLAHIDDVAAVVGARRRQQMIVGRQLTGLRQVDEIGDPRVDQPLQARLRLRRAAGARVFTGQQRRTDPEAVGEVAAEAVFRRRSDDRLHHGAGRAQVVEGGEVEQRGVGELGTRDVADAGEYRLDAARGYCRFPLVPASA